MHPSWKIEECAPASGSGVFRKQNTAQVLGNELHIQRDSATNLQEENALLRIDVAKKTAELQAMDLLRQRLENDIQNLRVQLQQRKRFW